MTAGFIRRFAAFVVDGFVLGAVGGGLSTVARDQLIALGPNGTFLGLFIAIIYFTILNSRLGGGRTVGKRLLGLRVVDANGRPISILRSAVRAALFASAYFLNGSELDLTSGGLVSTSVLIVLGIIVYGFGSAILFFSIFDWPLRRGFHDLMVGTLVIRGESAPPVTALSRRVLGSYLLLLVGLGGGMLFLNIRTSGSASDPTVERAMATARLHPNVISIPEAAAGPPLFLTLRISKPQADFRPTIPSLCKALQDAIPNDPSIAQTSFVLLHGFDIGIASSTETAYADCSKP